MKRLALGIAVSLAVVFVIRAHAASQEWTYCNVAAIAPAQQAMTVRCSGRVDAKTTVALYPLTIAQYVAIETGHDADSALKPSLTGIHFEQDKRYGDWVAQIPAQPIGLYLVRVNGANGRRDMLSSVSSIGVMAVSAGDSDAYAAVSLSDYRFVTQGVAMNVYAQSGSTPLARQSDGTFAAPQANDNGATVYATALDGSIAFVNPPYRMRETLEKRFLQTDRPIYRPGDVVHLRIIERRGYIGSYAIDRTPATVTVQQEYPVLSIARRVLTPDAYGTMATDVRIPSDAALGVYGVLVDGTDIGNFSVQAYKKPEYAIAVTGPAHPVLGGSDVDFAVHVSYFNGTPAGGFTVHAGGGMSFWRPFWYGPFAAMIPWRPQIAQSVDQTATTDRDGNATFRIPSKHADDPGYLYMTFDARDESGRTVSTRSNTEIVPAEFPIVMTPESWLAAPGRETIVALTTVGYDEIPRPGVRVRVHIVETNHDDRDIDRGSVTVTTDSHGAARFGFTPPEPGAYRYEARATDARGNAVAGYQYQWAPDPNALWQPPVQQPELIAAKSQFAPDETAHVLLALTKPDADALVLISTDRVIERRLIHVAGSTQDITFVPPAGAEQVQVHAYIPGAHGIAQAQTVVSIDPGPSSLRISVTPGKPVYQPGERALFRVHVTDDRGRAVRAQLGIGVVDSAIYALAPQVLDPRATFFRRLLYPGVSLDWQQTALMRFQPSLVADKVEAVRIGSENGVPQGVPAPTAAPIPAMQLRTNFQDTAYWSPAVVTDARGNATVAFTWPDDLTTWTSTALGITQRTQIGLERINTLVTKPFLVRLSVPRFLRAGDRAQITGIAQGKKAGTPVRLELDAPAFGVQSQQKTVLDENRRASVHWMLQAPGVGSALVALRGTDESLRDGMQVTLPLLAGTPVEHVRAAGIAHAPGVAIPTPIESGQLAGALHLSFSPSALAEIAGTMQQFDVYPFFCTEQTGSTGMVAAAFLTAARQIGGIDTGNKPEDVIERARKRLRQLRHGDGAWGWWPSDTTNAFMTSYALWSLKTMDVAEKVEDDPMIGSGARWLASDLTGDSQLSSDERALALYALAYAAPQQLPREMLAAELKGLDRDDVTTSAFLGLAAAAIADRDDALRAAGRLKALETVSGGMTYWHAGSWGWEWWTDPIADTSYAAMLFDAVGDRTREESAAAFLRAQRGGNWWYTTADTAAATTVLARIESRAAPAPAKQTVRVLIGERVVRTIEVRTLADASDTQIVIPHSEMQSHEPVTIERSGAGVLYWSSDFERYLNRNATTTKDADESILRRLFAAPPALSANRRYTVDHSGPWRVGDVVTVDLWITARDGAQYVTLEDPYPAGVEYQPAQGEAADQSWSGAQYLDDRAAFFIYWLPAGMTERLEYRLRVTTPGEYAAPGPSAYASYGPPVKAVGTGETVVIK